VKKKSRHLFLVFWFVLICQIGSAQYGLEFASHNMEADKRTRLQIGAKESISFQHKLSVSFDLSFLPLQQDYFGYIFRLITDDGVNIDLIYDRRLDQDKHFKLVVGEDFTPVSFNITALQLYYNWTPMRLELDMDKKELYFQVGTARYSYRLNKQFAPQFKLVFGANMMKNFQTMDVPPMRLKDIRIADNGKLKYYWPLDESSGTKSLDEQKKSTAEIGNPIWIKRQRSEWKTQSSFTLEGQASVAFDKNEETLFFVGNKRLMISKIGGSDLRSQEYADGKLLLVNGSQSLFDPIKKNVLNISIDQKIVAAYDSTSRTWNKQFDFPAVGTNYWLFNKYFNSSDTSIYMIGGYGHFKYKAGVLRYHLPTQSWDSIPFTGDEIFPHYLAGMGQGKDGVYLAGGYGSSTGDQMLNPRISNDFLKLDFKNRKSLKVYEFSSAFADMVWANSLVVEDSSGLFYGLIFPNNKFKTHLQLVAGSLKGTQYQFLGSSIPFDFHDIRSFADLYYAPKSKSFVAVTLFYDDKTDLTKATIYTLLAPPLPSEQGIMPLAKPALLKYSLYALAIMGLSLLICWYRKRSKQKKQTISVIETDKIGEPHLQAAPLKETEQDKSGQLVDLPQPKKVAKGFETRHGAGIYLFGGDLQIVDLAGKEITKKFSPLLKEMLLIFILYTVRWERGISSEKLTELFWSDKSQSSARNNRSVNIAKLNSLLEQLGDFSVTKKSGYWCIEPMDTVYIDYLRFSRMVSNKKYFTETEIRELLDIIDKGGFLFEVDYEWLDNFKSEMSILVLTTLGNFIENLNVQDNAELIIEICNKIFYFDEINEEAMVHKCRSLLQLGYHSLALQCYENFCQIYARLYGEAYPKSFKDCLD
jgi:two-component SAPR family response regulator